MFSFPFGKFIPLNRQVCCPFCLPLLQFYLGNGDPCPPLPWGVSHVQGFYLRLHQQSPQIYTVRLFYTEFNTSPPTSPLTTVLKKKGTCSDVLPRSNGCCYHYHTNLSWFWRYASILCSRTTLPPYIYTYLPRVRIYGQNWNWWRGGLFSSMWCSDHHCIIDGNYWVITMISSG